MGYLAVSRGLLGAEIQHPTAGVRAQFQRPFWQLAVLAITQRLPEAELASQTKNQLIEHIELRAPSNFQVLTPKIEASSSNGLALANCTVFAAKTPTNWRVEATGASLPTGGSWPDRRKGWASPKWGPVLLPLDAWGLCRPNPG